MSGIERSDHPKEKCAVFGLYASSGNAAFITSQGLFALNHRGQEGSGIASSDGKTTRIHKKEGLVSQVYATTNWEDNLPGHMSIGHNRYGTSSIRPSHHHLQPVISAETDSKLVTVHNGNLPDTTQLDLFMDKHNIMNPGFNDSEKMHAAIEYYLKKGASLPDAVQEAMPLFTGAYSLLTMYKDQIVALRDPMGVRPLSMGMDKKNVVFSSETCGLDAVNITHLRDVRPGEMVTVNQNVLHTEQLAPGEEHLDAFEMVYFARPDSILLGETVQLVRERLGEELAREDESNLRADMVIDAPNSGTAAAHGYAREIGIPYHTAFIKNGYTGRTFITPEHADRDKLVNTKLNAIPAIVKGKRVVLVDDSLVRGTTSRRTVDKLKNAGAKSIHLRIASPPVLFPDFYGIDTPEQQDLLAATRDLEAMKEYLGVSSLRFLSEGGMYRAIRHGESELSMAAFNGNYPIPIGNRAREVNFDLYTRLNGHKNIKMFAP